MCLRDFGMLVTPIVTTYQGRNCLNKINAECNTDTNGREWGRRHVQSALTYVGVRATCTEVLEALRQQDPSAVIARQQRILHRRTYDVTDAMALWHIDSRLCFS